MKQGIPTWDKTQFDRSEDRKKVLYKSCLFVSDDTFYMNVTELFAHWVCYLVV